MENKKSLGHFPFEQQSVDFDDSQYSFIPDISDINQGRLSEAEKPKNDFMNPFLSESHQDSDSVNFPFGDAYYDEDSSSDEESEEVKADKKVASYYLEVNVIRRIKSYANRIRNTYSGVVSEAIQNYLDEKDS